MGDTPYQYPRRGEIYYAPSASKVRPVVIVSNNLGNEHSNAVLVVPITSQPGKKLYAADVPLGPGDPLPKAGRVLCQSIYTLLKADLGDRAGEVSSEQLAAINKALALALSLPRPSDT